MSPIITIRDDFFPDPDKAWGQVVSGQFKDIVSPVDGIIYPAINTDLPKEIVEYFTGGVSGIMGARAIPNHIFARATTKNTPSAPNKIHSDKIMGDFSAHVYISKKWPEGSGTSFWSHKTEGSRHEEKTNVDIINADMNRIEPWTKILTCHAKFNRLLIHDAKSWHCAEPVGGFGETEEDGRVVLTMFFNLDWR